LAYSGGRQHLTNPWLTQAEGSTPAKKRSAKEAAAEAASFLDALDSEQVVPEAGGKKKKKKGSS
jgi:hypothetical protein